MFLGPKTREKENVFLFEITVVMGNVVSGKKTMSMIYGFTTSTEAIFKRFMVIGREFQFDLGVFRAKFTFLRRNDRTK